MHSTFTNAGRLASMGRTTVSAKDVHLNNGTHIASGGGLTVNASGDISAVRNATVYSRGATNITAGGAFASAATIFSDGDLLLHAGGRLSNSGNIVSNQDIHISSDRSVNNENTALVYAGQNLVVSSKESLSNVNNSLLLSELGLTLNVTQTFLNDGSIVQGGDVMITANSLLNRHSSLIHGLEALNIKVATLQDNIEGSILQVGNNIIVQAESNEIGGHL